MARERGALEKKLKNAKMSAAEKAKQLAAFNKAAQEQANSLNQQIAGLQGNLADAQARADASERAKTKLAGDMARERAEFEGKLKGANLSVQEKARQLAEFNQKARDREAAAGREIASLRGDLADAQEKANARAKLANEIASALRKAGVDANVNGQTGDVTVSFGKDYFDSGSSQLKPTMAQVLQKFIPKYSESLFKDPKIAEKITSVDIIGFASPTYQNRYVDPHSLNPEDKAAVKYNLDLSYKRASSIFEYMFDTNKIQYKNQKQLLGLVKVTGRSFFNEGRAPAGAVPGMSQKEFCTKFDCKQSQKVIIKFNMDDKK
jgi:outer membrane protein OmpA-like peptidoglycan-associated protein